jgi:hypothetical protein
VIRLKEGRERQHAQIVVINEKQVSRVALPLTHSLAFTTNLFGLPCFETIHRSQLRELTCGLRAVACGARNLAVDGGEEAMAEAPAGAPRPSGAQRTSDWHNVRHAALTVIVGARSWTGRRNDKTRTCMSGTCSVLEIIDVMRHARLLVSR